MGWLDVRRTLSLQSVFPARFFGGQPVRFRQLQVLHPNPGAAGACENRRLEPLDELAHGDECLPLPLGGNRGRWGSCSCRQVIALMEQVKLKSDQSSGHMVSIVVIVIYNVNYILIQWNTIGIWWVHNNDCSLKHQYHQSVSQWTALIPKHSKNVLKKSMVESASIHSAIFCLCACTSSLW